MASHTPTLTSPSESLKEASEWNLLEVCSHGPFLKCSISTVTREMQIKATLRDISHPLEQLKLKRLHVGENVKQVDSEAGSINDASILERKVQCFFEVTDTYPMSASMAVAITTLTMPVVQ